MAIENETLVKDRRSYLLSLISYLLSWEKAKRGHRSRAMRGYDSPCFVFSQWCGLVKNWMKARHPLTLISAQ